jgi:hypothetical protein
MCDGDDCERTWAECHQLTGMGMASAGGLGHASEDLDGAHLLQPPCEGSGGQRRATQQPWASAYDRLGGGEEGV